jgi:hypothetical protein
MRLLPVLAEGHPKVVDYLHRQGIEPDREEPIQVPNCPESWSFFEVMNIIQTRDDVPSTSLARAWMSLPLEKRDRVWVREENHILAIRAQLYATVFGASDLFETEVPHWMPGLIDASRTFKLVALSKLPEWGWLRTATPLGVTCIGARLREPSWSGELEQIGLSSCNATLENPITDQRAQASAVRHLYEVFQKLNENPSLAESADWNHSAHTILEIEKKFAEWFERLETKP